MSIIGIDIGGTKCAVCEADDKGQILCAQSFPTGEVADTLKIIYEMVGDCTRDDSTIIGISCGSPLDLDKGLIMSPPNLPQWENVPIVAELTARFGHPAYLMNDANAGALAEWIFGDAKRLDNFIFLTCGTGMGAGLILGGKLYEGTSGNAGEVGHIRLTADGPIGCGKPGSFEGWCSGGGLAQYASQIAEERDGPVAFKSDDGIAITARDVAQSAAAGDQVARELLKTFGRRLGQSLAILIDTLNPQRIIIGSLFQRCEPYIRPAMETELIQECLPQNLRDCQITPPSLGEAIGNHAAIAIALYKSGRLGSTHPHNE